MSRFFVGQRVRVVRWWPEPCFGRHLIGQEGVVNKAINATTGGGALPAVGITAAGESKWAAPWWGLEPVLPEGQRACDEDFKRDLDRMLSKEESRVS